MTIFHHQHRKYRFFCWANVLIVLLLSTIPVRLAIATISAPSPQAILTLGGGTDREEFTAEFAQVHPYLDIWVSSGTPCNTARKIFQAAGIADRRIYFDYRAIDTVTNFTTLVSDFKKRNIQHIYLITSDSHMPRARAIAALVLGSQGIAFTSVSLSDRPEQPTESWFPLLRDIGRSLLWIVTGRTGASLSNKLSNKILIQARSVSFSP
jgi:uncharacterized SAM-binding protein YcdF (DUF218 family)